MKTGGVTSSCLDMNTFFWVNIEISTLGQDKPDAIRLLSEVAVKQKTDRRGIAVVVLDGRGSKTGANGKLPSRRRIYELPTGIHKSEGGEKGQNSLNGHSCGHFFNFH